MKFGFLFLITFLGLQMSYAQQVGSIPELGFHYPIFKFEKSENPQNVLVAYTKLDKDCRVLADLNNDQAPTFDFYWLMDRINYKPTHPIIKSRIKDRLQVLTNENQSFLIEIKDLKEVESDLEDAKLTILTRKTARGTCEVQPFITLGPSDKNVTIRLKSIYSETDRTFLPPFHCLKSITLKGIETETGRTVSRKYFAKK